MKLESEKQPGKERIYTQMHLSVFEVPLKPANPKSTQSSRYFSENAP